MLSIKWTNTVDWMWPWWRIYLRNWLYGLKHEVEIRTLVWRGRTILRAGFESDRKNRLTVTENKTVSTLADGSVRQVAITMPAPEVYAWLEHNLVGEMRYMTDKRGDALFVFSNPNSALAFKMRWF